MVAKTEEKKGGFLELLKTIVYALLLAGLIRTLLFQPFWIPSGSMKPTLLIGDFLFVNKFAYGYSAASCPSYGSANLCWFAADASGRFLGGAPERGDVIVFKHPTNGSDYIKRLVGLPGDTVQMQDGQLFLNGQAVPKEPDGSFTETMERQGPLQDSFPNCSNAPVGEGGVCEKTQFVETLPNGAAHATLDIRESFGDDTPAFTVPEGQYFLMGDNRDNSLDSRFSLSGGGVGLVPYENLIGRADRIIFSSGGASMFFFWTWRGDRFFIPVE